MEAPADENGKVRITPARVEEWTRDAGVLLDANCRPAEVIRDLRARGCTPRMAERIVARAGGPVRGAHRRLGVRALLLGGGMIALGWVISAVFNHSYRAMELMALGGVAVALGLYKLLTGSAVDMDRVMHPQDYRE
jgi:hypothetical protein